MLKNLNLTFDKSNPHPRNRPERSIDKQNFQKNAKKRVIEQTKTPVPILEEKTEETILPLNNIESEFPAQGGIISDDPWTDKEPPEVLNASNEELTAQMEKIATGINQRIASTPKRRRNRKVKN